MKKIALLFMICCMCTACGAKEAAVTETSKQTEVTTEAATEATTEATTEAAAEAAKTIIPLPATINMDKLDNCT